MERGVVSGTRGPGQETQLRSSLLLTGVVCAVALVAIAAVAYVVARGAVCTTSDTGIATRANCNDDRNVRDPCIVLDTARCSSWLQSQLGSSNTASGNESLGPIRDIFESRPGSLDVTLGSIERGTVSYTRSTRAWVGSTVRNSTTPLNGSRVVDSPQLVIASAPLFLGPFHYIRLLSNPAGLAEWSGYGLPNRLQVFDSPNPLHFYAARNLNPLVVGTNDRGSRAIETKGENGPSRSATFRGSRVTRPASFLPVPGQGSGAPVH